MSRSGPFCVSGMSQQTSARLRLTAPSTSGCSRYSSPSNITSVGDALWRAVTTITTVGNGDRYPTTTSGRAVTLGLMLAGIALLGVVTTTLAS
jgi:voltage-gated potassium channel